MSTATQQAISAEDGARIVQWCRSQIGVPWIHQGRAPGRGLDCVGLPVCGARAVGFARVADMLEYSESPSPAQLLECVSRNCVPVEGPDQPGDLWLMWVRREFLPQHATVWTGEGSIVHAKRFQGSGNVSEERVDLRWLKHLHSKWRLCAWLR
jgi:cell wall-associated NlpC family hydrolase